MSNETPARERWIQHEQIGIINVRDIAQINVVPAGLSVETKVLQITCFSRKNPIGIVGFKDVTDTRFILISKFLENPFQGVLQL